MGWQCRPAASGVCVCMCTCECVITRLSIHFVFLHLNTHIQRTYICTGLCVCSLVRKCMPFCICIFPMKNILYICVLFMHRLAVSECVSSRCVEVRAELPSLGPDVSRCGLQVHAMWARLSLDHENRSQGQTHFQILSV